MFNVKILKGFTVAGALRRKAAIDRQQAKLDARSTRLFGKLDDAIAARTATILHLGDEVTELTNLRNTL